jgi:hypothetical protein
MHRGTPYVICDNNGNPVTAAEAKKIIAEKWTVPEDVRKRRRSRKTAGKALSRPQPGPTGEATSPAPDRPGHQPRASTTPQPPPLSGVLPRHKAACRLPPDGPSQPASKRRPPCPPKRSPSPKTRPTTCANSSATPRSSKPGCCTPPTASSTSWPASPTTTTSHFHPYSATWWLIEDLGHLRCRLRKTLPGHHHQQDPSAVAPSVKAIAKTGTSPTAPPRDRLDTATSIGNQIPRPGPGSPCFLADG